jgi:2-phospho-L-lactate guanylyltransferase (CobY/MobA/RfbA family)
MLRRVLLAARGSSAQSVTVVGGGVNVRRIASKYFAEWTASLGNDLNADLMDSIKARESEGFSTIYLPGDLPFVQPIDIDTVIDASRQGR